jgi:cytochrome c2
VPWQKHQEKFFDLRTELAKQAVAKTEADWEHRSAEEPLKSQLARLAELDAEKEAGPYAEAKKKLAELDAAFAAAEQGKTFGASDLDEAYYYRNLAEYDRDAKKVEVLRLFKELYPDDAARAQNEPAAIYADPASEPAGEGESAATHHLKSEVARMQAHVDKLREAEKGGHPPELVRAIRASRDAELEVKSRIEIEIGHQRRIDAAESRMKEIDGPEEPRVTAADPKERETKRDEARKAACEGKEDASRNCLRWVRLEPVDREHKQLTIAVSQAGRELKEAKQALSDALAQSDPKFDIKNPIKSLVGPFQIEQIVTSWMIFERDVDIQQVDRCHTCHMGVNNGLYTDANILEPFRTHPRRDELLAAHPVERFGCTACHQGQGRATDELAHSGWQLEMHHGKERWHFAGDHYWEDPLLPVGKLSKIVIDEHNDQLSVKLGRSKPSTLTLTAGVYDTEQDFFEALQAALQGLVDGDEAIAAVWRAVARKVDNRVQIGLEPKDPTAAAPEKLPDVVLSFPKRGLSTLLGFGPLRELNKKNQLLFTAARSPVQPVRADSAAAAGAMVDDAKDYQFTPPNGAHGLQVTDDMRNRFIQALPEIESGCLRCHGQDSDLRPRRSHARHITAKLARQRAEAEHTADPAAYREKHGTDELPPPVPGPAEAESLAPTLDQGRALFRQLNCTGCHLLEGFSNNTDQGPQLNDVSAKVTPEWLLAWLRHPRGWRAKTSMPNLWPAPLDPASKMPFAEGSPEFQRWKQERAEETIAVAAFLWERSEVKRATAGATIPAGSTAAAAGSKSLRETISGYANVDGASADHGKKLFESYGCEGCHATVQGGAKLAEPWRQRERDIAPTLANLGAKTNVDWLAYWIENPSRYWHGTAMPSLRLTRLEAASIARYLVGLKAPPPAQAEVAADEVKLVSDAKLRQQTAPCRAAGGVTLTRVECGAKVIEQRGCYGCHNIDGFQNLAPIGPELTGFAQKDVTTLDFGYAISDHHLHTTETFATLKLDSPRIYERDRIELKMGDFDLSADEIRALVVFLKGTVNGKPNDAFDPMKQPSYVAAVAGRQLVEDLNCRGCHIIEGRGADLDKWGRLLARDVKGGLRAPWLDGEGARVQPEWLFTFLRDPGQNPIRPWLHPEQAFGSEIPDDMLAPRMPTFTLTPEQWTNVVRYFATWDQQPYPYEVPRVAELTKDERLYAATNMNSAQTGNCFSCHYFRDFPVERAKADLWAMAPDLDKARRRLRPEWVHQWLLRPQNYLAYTRMTAFFATVDRPKNAPLWPAENDPFRSPPATGWDVLAPNLKLPPERQAAVLRDLLFGLSDGVPWPLPGQEADSALVDPDAARLRATQEEPPGPGGRPAGARPPGDQPGR